MLTIADFPVTQHYPTHWGDMDSARHINNLIYLRWAETARLALFEAMGMDVSFAAGDTGPILGWQDCKYIFPMTHPDVAIVGVRVSEIAHDRFTIQTAVFSERHGRIAAISHQVIVPYDYGRLQKASLPAAWLLGIENLGKNG